MANIPIFINKRMGIEIVVYSYNEILFSNKKITCVIMRVKLKNTR